jgi:endoglucanase
MGVVYEARHMVVGRRFAVKFLRPYLAERRDILTRFHREAKASGALESENIAAAVDFGIAPDGAPFIVMEYLVGESLASLIERQGRLPLSRAADLVSQASRGIQVAHDAGIIHRDLKPQNLFVCRRQDGTDLLKVLDFGVAKLHDLEGMNAVTHTGVVLGTVAYMSPEQARGARIVDHRTDVYTLGAILYELVSGRKPHLGESYNAILHHAATEQAVPLETVQSGLPAALVEIVGRAVSSDPEVRPPSAEAFAQALVPFAMREIWPAPKVEESGPTPVVPTSTLLAQGELARRNPPASDRAGAIANDHSAVQPRTSPARRGLRRVAAIGAAMTVVAIVAVVGVGGRRSTIVSRPAGESRSQQRLLDPSTRFFAPPLHPGAGQQIAALVKAKAFHDAALLTAMATTPQAVWFEGGSPEEVHSEVRTTVLRAAREGRVPVLVAYNLPYRDCAQYGAGGAADSAAYVEWIDGFAKGLANEKVVVILEPNGLGVIPYSTEWCNPTITDAKGKTVRAPGATPEDRYDVLAKAIDILEGQAPNAAVYLDGTHGHWLPVGEIAHRLANAGIARVQGFTVNLSNFQPTPEAIKYGTWVSECIAYASNPAVGANKADPYSDCPSPRRSTGDGDSYDWSSPDPWYAEKVRARQPPSGESRLAHFVIDTGRNGRGPLDAKVFAAAPYGQPPAVIAALIASDYCNPPRAGVGLRPSANTGVPLVDAYLWVKAPGESDGSCDIDGNFPRPWDYSRFNPWGMTGESQKHFDPLWGMVDPEVKEWFPEYALQLARNAEPPLPADELSKDTAASGR